MRTTTTPMTIIGRELEVARIRAGLTKGQVAEMTGIRYPTLAKRYREPDTMTLSELVRIARATGMKLAIGSHEES